MNSYGTLYVRSEVVEFGRCVWFKVSAPHFLKYSGVVPWGSASGWFLSGYHLTGGGSGPALTQERGLCLLGQGWVS